MLPCRSTCTCAFEGCHKTCPRWRAMQEQQHAETARKKEYLRQADEDCRAWRRGPKDLFVNNSAEKQSFLTSWNWEV